MQNKDLSTILSLIERKFGRGSSASWKNRDFEDLNFEIQKETKTNISAHTLKRIFGKLKTDEYYLPQKATIIALKKYVKFEKPEITNTEQLSIKNILNTEAPQQQITKQKEYFSRPLKFAFIALIVTGLIAYIFLRKSTNISPDKMGEIKLISTEGRIPKSAEFEYTTPNSKDSFSICYDGYFEPIPVPNGIKMKSTYYYQYPGYFKVRMWKKKVIVSESTPVYLQTNGWEAFGLYHQQKQLEHFFPISVDKMTKNGIFSPTKDDIRSLGMDTNKLVEIRMENYKPTGSNGDNFTLETTLKNSDVWSQSNCNSVFLVITGRKESIKLHFTNPGCSYWIRFRLSEKMLNNKNDNLSDFVFNLAEWQKLRVENRNKNISIFVNDIKRYSNYYNETIGEIVGVTVIFQGNGYLKNYLLSDLNGREIFKFPGNMN